MHVIVAPVSTSRLLVLLAGVWTAAAALVSRGGLAFTGAPSTASAFGARIGVVPVDGLSLTLAGVAALVVVIAGWWSGRGRAVAIAVTPLALVLLAWLPWPVPAAFLVWQGALGTLAWIAAAAGLIVAIHPAIPAVSRPAGPILPALAAAAIFSLAAWGASPSLPGGDEPHYLVITQSLLLDRDIAIENNHRRGDYRAYYPGDLPPDSIRRGRDGQVYSIHAPGVSAIVAPAFAIGGYRGVVVFLILVAAAASGLAWWLAWRVTNSRAAAWFGWAVIAVSAPFVLEAFTVYPDGLGAAVVLTGFWALLRAEWEQKEGGEGVVPWLLHGVALALLPWMHTRFAVLAGTLGGLILVRIARVPNPLAKAIAFLSVPAVSALAWLFFFTVIYGAPDPSAPYGGRVENSFAFLPNGLGGILFDQGFGLLATAPILVAAFAGLTRVRRLALEWLVVAGPYLLSVTTFAMWWAGSSGPARFLVPLLLPLAIPAACTWASRPSRSVRMLLIAALVISGWLSAVMAGGGGGRLGYHTRNETGLTAAPWLQWASTVVDLPSAFPAFVPQPVQPDPGGRVSRANAARTGFLTTTVWVICLGATIAGVVILFRRRDPAPEAMVAGTALGLGVASMIAMSIVWRIHGSDRITATAAQLDVLRRLAGGPVVAANLDDRHRLSRDEAAAMRIEIPVRRRGGGGRPNRALATFPAVPAGAYLLTAKRQGGEGWLMVGVGADQFALVTQPIADFDAGVRIDLPLPVRALLVRADEGARDQLQSVELRPLPGSTPPLSQEIARRAVRYEGATAFFVDEGSFPEPSGFWIAGGRESAVAIRPDIARSIPLLLRNGAAPNEVTLESGTWRDALSFAPGEERRVDVPVGASGAAMIRIRAASGFRPSEVDSNSRDTRWLSVFVTVSTPDSQLPTPK